MTSSKPRSRGCDLIDLIANMDAKDKVGIQPRLDQLSRSANALLEYMKEYKTHSVTKLLYRRLEMLVRIDQFDQEVAALSLLYQLAIGALNISHTRELLRGMRELLQGGSGQRTKDRKNEYLSSSKRQQKGKVADAQAAGDIPTLTGLMMDSKEVSEVEQAAIALCELAESADTRDAFVLARVAESLVKMLDDNKHRSMVAYALHRLARCDSYEVKIVDAGALARLASMLDDTGSITEGETSAACAALTRLATQAHHKKRIIETQSLLERAVGLVYSGSVAQKRHATRILRELANNSEECASRITEYEAIPVMVDLLYVGETPELRAEALGALWNLSSIKKNRTEIADQCGVKAIVEQLDNGDTDEHCQLAASTLTVLAQDDENDHLIGDAGGIKPLVRLLVSGTPQQRNSSVWALAELANHKGNAIEMVKLGVTRALWAAFRSASDTQRRSKAGLALTWIAKLVDDKSIFKTEIGLKNIARLLERGLTDQKQNAPGIMRGIAEDRINQRELTALGVIPLLMEQIAASSQKQTGIEALCALARGSEATQIAIADLNGIEKLTTVMASDDGNFVSAVEALTLSLPILVE